MAIINKKIGNTTYVYEMTAFRTNGKVKHKWEIKGKLDENGKLIPSKKRNPEEPQAETKGLLMSIETEKVEDNIEATEADHHQNQISQEVNVPAVPEKPTEIQDTGSEVTEAEIITEVSSIVRSDKYNFGTTKAEGIVFDARKNEGLYSENGGAVNTSRNEIKRKEINVMISLNFDELKQEGEVKIYREYRLTPFDRVVHNAIATLWETGHRNKMKNNEYLTPRIIFQLLSGNTGNSKDLSPEMRKAILESIDKMKHTGIVIDASAEARAYGYEVFNHIGSLLEVERIESIKINGREVEDCIHIFRSPALYDYAKLKNQIGNVDIRMLNIPDFRNSSENIELKEYLLQRVIAIKNAKSRMNETIRYETIYEYLRIEAQTKHALQVKYKQIRDKVKKILDFWKNKKLIKNYREEKEGKIIAKVTIIC